MIDMIANAVEEELAEERFKDGLVDGLIHTKLSLMMSVKEFSRSPAAGIMEQEVQEVLDEMNKALEKKILEKYRNVLGKVLFEEIVGMSEVKWVQIYDKVKQELQI